MQHLHHELSVLAKAVQFKNLSAAALHVGLSQPQLSRIIAKIEEELQVVLLDRSAKRKSGWTPVAQQLADIFEKSLRRLESDLQSISNKQMVAELHIGTLEGMTEFALKVSRKCFEKVGIKKIDLNIYDLSELEANFLSGNLDIILTSKMPGRQKFRHLIEIGYQQLQPTKTNSKYGVYSSFEYSRLHKNEHKDFQHVLVSNSLLVRKEWLKSPGGTGLLPSGVKKGKVADNEPVYLIGSEILNPALWKNISDSFADLIKED